MFLSVARIDKRQEFKHLIPTIFAIILFLFEWISLKDGQYNSFHNYVFDLGINYNILWRTLNNIGSIGWLSSFSPYRLIYYFITPVLLINESPLILLYFQTILIGVSSYAIYNISLKLTANWKISSLFSIIYLVYFPLGGPLWYDFHFQALFPFFYLFSIYFFLIKRYKMFITFSVFAMLTNLFAPVLVLSSSVFFLVEETSFRDKRISEISKSDVWNAFKYHKYTLIVLFSSVLFLLYILTFSLVTGGTFLQAITQGSNASSSGDIVKYIYESVINNWFLKIELILILLGSLAFIPLFRPRTILLYGPYILFALPTTLHLEPFGTQYMALFSPGYFISAIYVISKLKMNRPNSLKIPQRRHKEIKSIFNKFIRSQFVIIILVIIILVNISIFLPYSPLNSLTKQSTLTSYAFYDVHNNTDVTSYDLELMNMVKLVPTSMPALIQGNIPQLTNRAYFETPGFYTGMNSVSLLINDPSNYFYFYQDSYGDHPGYSMFQLSNIFLNSGNFGVLAEVQGAMVLEKGYTGEVKYFVPETEDPVFYKSYINGSTILTSNQLFISPGSYSININFNNTSSASGSYLNLSLFSTQSRIPFFSNSTQMGSIVRGHIANNLTFRSDNYIQQCIIRMTFNENISIKIQSIKLVQYSAL